MFHSFGRPPWSLYVRGTTLPQCCYICYNKIDYNFFFFIVENGSWINSSQKVCVLIDL